MHRSTNEMSINDRNVNQGSKQHHLSRLNNNGFKPMSGLGGPYTSTKTSIEVSPNRGVETNSDNKMNLTSVGLINHRSRISSLVGQSQELKNMKRAFPTARTNQTAQAS